MPRFHEGELAIFIKDAAFEGAGLVTGQTAQDGDGMGVEGDLGRRVGCSLGGGRKNRSFNRGLRKDGVQGRKYEPEGCGNEDGAALSVLHGEGW